MKYKEKEIWIRFNDMEEYDKNKDKLFSITKKHDGTCSGFIFVKREFKIFLLTHKINEDCISLLQNAFGEENVKSQEKESEIECNKPRIKIPKIKQIIPCNHDIYAVMKDAEGLEYKCKVLMFALCDDDEIYPLHFETELGISSLYETDDVEFYEMEKGEFYSSDNVEFYEMQKR